MSEFGFNHLQNQTLAADVSLLQYHLGTPVPNRASGGDVLICGARHLCRFTPDCNEYVEAG
jgi:hypothetical protein